MSTYNERGRLISFKDEYGRLTKISYCPVTGNASCPAIPKNWSFGAPVESVIRYPAPCDKRSPPAVRIYNYYHKVINHTGSGYILMLDHQIYQAGQQKRTMIRHYYRNVHDPFSYGLLKQIILTGNAAEDASLTSLINNYYYIKSTDGYRKTSYTTTVLGDKQSQLSSAVTTSLFTNQLLKSVKPDGRNITLYHYDLWGRLIQTDFAVSTSFATSRYYQYTISNRLNQVIITAPNGLQNKIIFDGAGRTLMSFDEALTADGRPLSGQWWLRQSTAYNRYGQIASYKAYQFDSTGKTYTLTATPNHDYSGRATSVHLSNGETDFIQYDDAFRCVVNYRRNVQNEYSVLSVSRYNILNKPVKYWVLPAPNGHLPDMKTLCLRSDKQTDKVSFITYDGFGRVVLQNTSGRITKQYYNALGQVTDTVNSAGSRIHNIYDLTSHITAIAFFGINGEHYLLSSAHYNAAGQLMWEYQIEAGNNYYHYTVDGLTDFVITSTGHRISWHYNLPGLLWHRVKPPSDQTIVYGFNGKRTENLTGWQFLGAGNRVYNPQQRHFLSEDPLGSGYCFAGNNPIMNIDPDGNMPRWLGAVFKWAGYVGTAGLGALHNKWVNLATSVVAAGLSVAAFGATAASAGSTALATVATGIAAVGSCIPVVTAVTPANKGLNITSAVVGITQMVTVIATSAVFAALGAELAEESSVSATETTIYKPPGMLKASSISGKSSLFVPFDSTKTAPLSHALDSEEFIGEMFMSKAPHLVSFDKGFLRSDKMKNALEIYKILCLSAYGNNVACDAGTIIMTATFFDRYLDIELLRDFLIARRNFASVGSRANYKTYYFAIVRLLDSLARPESEITITSSPAHDYWKIHSLISINKTAVVASKAHMSIVKRLPASWRAYVFYDNGTVFYERFGYRSLVRQFRDPKDKTLKINIFMPLE